MIVPKQERLLTSRTCEAEPAPSSPGGTDGVYNSDPSNKKRSHLCTLGWDSLISASAPKKTDVAVDESKAKSFLGSLKRQRRQLWDRTRPEVQQWYQQFLYMGFDEAVGIRSCGPGFLQGSGGGGVGGVIAGGNGTEI